MLSHVLLTSSAGQVSKYMFLSTNLQFIVVLFTTRTPISSETLKVTLFAKGAA